MKKRLLTSSLLLLSCVVLFSFGLLSEIDHKTRTYYCHGLGGDPIELEYFRQKGLIQDPSAAYPFDDNFEAKGSCLGQAHDIETFKESLKESVDNQEKVIIFANSARAAGTIIYLAQENPEHVVAVVLKSGPADMINIVDEYQYKFGLFPLLTRSSKEWALRQIHSNYPVNSVPPVQAIPSIENKELPIFISHSVADEVVNVRSGYQLYKAFKQAGFKNVYFSEWQKSGHNRIAKDDFYVYERSLHSFYKQHGCKHDATKATMDLKSLQPSVDEIDKKLDANLWQLRSQSIMNICIVAGIAALYFGMKYFKKQ